MLAKAPTLLDKEILARMATERAERTGPLDAEISPVQPARWYLVQTFAGHDNQALRWLARRRFGVFQPLQQRRLRRNGMAVQGWEQVFPGWLFLYCWDVDRMIRRIRQCPGVWNVFCYPNTETAVPIEEDFIERLRALSWIYNENAPRLAGIATTRAARSIRRAIHKAPKIDKRQRKELERLKKRLKQKHVWDEAEWEEANRLAPHARIALLRRTLNLPLGVAPEGV